MKRQLVSALIVGVFAILAVGSTDGGSSPDSGGAAKQDSGAVAAAPVARVEAQAPASTHFAHGSVNVRSGPGERYRVLRQLKRGDSLSLGEPDARGWARIQGADSGYVSVRAAPVRTERPAEIPDYSAGDACADEMRAVHARMNRAPDEVKEFEQAGVYEVTWWYREHPRDTYPRYQFSFLQGPYQQECRTSTIENG